MGREERCGPRREALAAALTAIMECAQATPEPRSPTCREELRKLQRAVNEYAHHACKPSVDDVGKRGVKPTFLKY